MSTQSQTPSEDRKSQTPLEEREAAAKAEGQIGYYNANNYPVYIASGTAGRGSIELDPMEAVKDYQGRLVAFDRDLEMAVNNNKMLRRIIPADSNYEMFVAAEARTRKQRVVPSVPAREAPVRTNPVNPLSSAPLPDGVTHLPNGLLTVDGKEFSTLASLHAYLDNK